MAPLMPAPAQQQFPRQTTDPTGGRGVIGPRQMPPPANTPFMSQRRTVQPYQTGMTPQQGAGGDPYGGTTPVGGDAMMRSGGVAPSQARGGPAPRPEIPGQPPGGPVQPPTGIYDVYEQGRNRMLEDAQRGIEGAMASAGFSGNRYSSSAMNQAAEQFRRHSQPFEEQWTNMLYQQGQSDLNRQLQATAMGLEHSLGLEGLKLQNLLGQGRLGLDFARWMDDAMAGRIAGLGAAGQAETARGDEMQQIALNEYNLNKFGYLPLINQFLTGTMPQQQQPVTTTTGGSPGAGDYLQTAFGIWASTGFAGLSDRRMKTNIKKTGVKMGPFPVYTYKFKGTNKRGLGPMAQDVEKVYPDAVVTLPDSDFKIIDTKRLIQRMSEA